MTSQRTTTMNHDSATMLGNRCSLRLGHLGVCSAIMLSVLLSACVHAPGMQMDVSTEALVRAQADFYTVDRATLRELKDQRTARESSNLRILPAPFKVDRSADYEYSVSPQDMLRVTVWNHPELTNPSGTKDELVGRVVNADGTMFFPFVGSFKAAGLNVREIRDVIVRGLSKVIRNPQVEVSVMTYRGQRVYVSGEVRSPGVQAITDVPPDLADIVARAGGATTEADLAGVTVTRGATTMRVDMVSLYYGGDLRSNVRLQHGDVVNIPERRGDRVFVSGEVMRPTTVFMPRGRLTLADVLADAGGVNPLSAAAGQVYVIRAGADMVDPYAVTPASSTASSTASPSTPGAATKPPRARIFHLNASSPDALLLADQFVLASRDVVYVDVAPVVRWARLINNILPSATGLRETLNDSTRGLPR